MTLYAYRTSGGQLTIADEHGHAIYCTTVEELDRTLGDLHGDQLPARTIFGWRPDGRSAARI